MKSIIAKYLAGLFVVLLLTACGVEVGQNQNIGGIDTGIGGVDPNTEIPSVGHLQRKQRPCLT